MVYFKGNNMKNIFKLLILATCLIFATQAVRAAELARSNGAGSLASSGFKERFNAIESESLRISLDDKNYGFVEGKVCDACEVIKVTITPETKAFANRVEVPLKNAKSRLGRFATVFYELSTKKVSSIRW